MQINGFRFNTFSIFSAKSLPVIGSFNSPQTGILTVPFLMVVNFQCRAVWLIVHCYLILGAHLMANDSHIN